MKNADDQNAFAVAFIENYMTPTTVTVVDPICLRAGVRATQLREIDGDLHTSVQLISVAFRLGLAELRNGIIKNSDKISLSGA